MKIVHKTNVSNFDAGLGCVLSDMSVDAYHDVVGDPSDSNLGWNLDDFKKNPIALWSHDSRSPIGVWRDVSVVNRALRGVLHLAPPGSTRLVDELRALLAANVVKGISVGFSPIEYKPRGDGGGTHYLKQKLVEASLVSVPANPAALLTAKALGISKETIQKIFKQSETSSNAQRLRDYRRSIRKLKERIARETNAKTRASMMRALKHLENAEREMSASLSPRTKLKQDDEQDYFMDECISNLEDQGIDDAEDVCQILWEERANKQQSRARALAAIRRVDERLAREYAASPAGQAKRLEAETLANFERLARRHPQDPPKPTEGGPTTWRGADLTPRWRGQKLPGLTWRGRKI
jgi:HK97 family phage prohead protease